MNVGVQTDSRPLMLVGFVLVLIVIGAGYMVYGRKKPVKEPSIPARETVGRKTA